jgi:hypothetical protein
MRIYLSLILTTILLSFSTAYFALNLQKDNLATADEILEIKKLENEFQKQTKPLMELDLSSMYPTRDYFQLIQSTAQTFNQETYLSKECGKSSGGMSKSVTSKGEIWESFRCRDNAVLPTHFFELSPLIHENGMSYAYLAFTSGMAPFNDHSWVKKHLNFFHISELKLLPIDALDENFKILSKLNDGHFESIIKGQSSLLTEDYYLSKKKQKVGHLYRVFSRLDFEKFLNARSYYAKSYLPGEKCFFTEGSICWQKDSGDLLQMLRPSSIIIFSSSVLILLLVCLSLYSRIKLQNREEERKRHALRVLTHELRTPIANLMLQIESLNKQSDIISPSILEEFLKMEGEVYRLKRLAEKSSSYLNSQSDSFDYREISSVNELIRHILEDYQIHNIEFIPLVTDHSISLDVYWFSVCLKNLIENALHHGAKPIQVAAVWEDEFLKIDVKDNGQIKFNDLEDIIKAEGRINSATGLGMGLSIVKRIMKEMNGKLSFSSKPTTFSLLMRNK